MVMQSSLYRSTVMHHRLAPTEHRFVYSIFLFCLDLDEIPMLARNLWLFGHNRKNVFEFRDADHLSEGTNRVKDSVIAYVRSKGVQDPVTKVLLITHLRTLGYIFNPVSFYFCYGPGDEPLCCVAEVMNTYREMKLFLIRRDHFARGMFRMVRPKHFYVSPFVDLDDMFEFRLALPRDHLRININDIDKRGNTFLVTSLSGEQRKLTNLRLLGYLVRFPFVTVKVIWSIHWQALRLYMKGLPYHTKASDPHLQQEVHYAGH
jgi:DUF1365 family protein